MRSASALRASWRRFCCSGVSDPSPISNEQILKRLTPERRASLLWDIANSVRVLRRLAAAVVDVTILERSCHPETLALNVGALANLSANVGEVCGIGGLPSFRLRSVWQHRWRLVREGVFDATCFFRPRQPRFFPFAEIRRVDPRGACERCF